MRQHHAGVMRRAIMYPAVVLMVVGGLPAMPAIAAPSGIAPTSAVRHDVPRARHPGMTWAIRVQRADGVVNVGADARTNAYAGDTPAAASLPILCLLVDKSPVPRGVKPDFYNGWARGWVALTPEVQGTRLTSRQAADGICTANFGPGWRMAEHHNGWYGTPPQRSHWHFWARGVIPSQTRFWVSIDDQRANPWN